ncbi:methyltransferase domain-containing protein [Amycolatopsis sp. NPDC051903]|uniref:methyltransferase domain-containing protein n=1 Tax=Amycolatopsis sp. NPDC051903 TaxID=3363936 RepID=UPI003791B945
MLGKFAELVGTTGPIGDLGCGPGRLTGYLASLALDVFGVDLSPDMVDAPRRAIPSCASRSVRWRHWGQATVALVARWRGSR